MTRTFIRIFSAFIFLIASSYMLTSGFRILSGKDDLAIFFVYVMLAVWVSSIGAFVYSLFGKGNFNE